MGWSESTLVKIPHCHGSYVKGLLYPNTQNKKIIHWKVSHASGYNSNHLSPMYL